MELRQLRAFVKIAETCNFSLAAKELYTTQSALSQSLKKLEDELGMTLFHRDNHNVGLTEAGDALLPFARRTIEYSDNCVNKMHDLMNMKCGTLNIGVTHSFRILTSDTLNVFVKRYPNIKLNIFYKTIPELREMLLRNEVDMIFSVDRQPEGDESIISVPATEYKLCAVMRDTHPLADRSILKFEDMAHQHFVLPEPGIRDRNAVEVYLHEAAADVNVRAVINDPNALLNLVHSTNYISILSERVIVGREGLRAVDIEELSQPIVAYAKTLRSTYQKRSAQMFVELLKENSNLLS